MEFKLSSRYSLSNNWYEQLSHSAEIMYNTSTCEPLKFDPKAKRIIVEIGIFEGASTCWWSDNLLDHPESQLYSIDPFTGSEEHHASASMSKLLPNLEATARRNIELSKNASKVSINPARVIFEKITRNSRASAILAEPSCAAGKNSVYRRVY